MNPGLRLRFEVAVRKRKGVGPSRGQPLLRLGSVVVVMATSALYAAGQRFDPARRLDFPVRSLALLSAEMQEEREPA
jgi:hypothetical protein